MIDIWKIYLNIKFKILLIIIKFIKKQNKEITKNTSLTNGPLEILS